MTVPMPPAPGSLSCEDFVGALARLESATDAPGTLERIQRHAGACARCRLRHGARLARAEGLSALRTRAVPDGLLDGLSDRVLARARNAEAGGGMSRAFLDAPHSLARWRTAASAAGLLVALTGGLLASGRLGWRGDERPTPRDDGWVVLRDVALEPWDAVRSDDTTTERVQPVVLGGRRATSAYWADAADRGHVIVHPVPPAKAK